MIDFSEIIVSEIAVHYVGNKLNGGKIVLSENSLSNIDINLQQVLKEVLVQPFAKKEDFFHFVHSSDLNLNEVYNYSQSIFESHKKFSGATKKIVKHLYQAINHPRINPGEVIIALFENIYVDNNQTNAIGIFKSETKNSLIKIINRNDNFTFKVESGISHGNIEKGCLILDLDIDGGYYVLVSDLGKSKTEETIYWNDTFLQVSPRADEFFNTKNYLKLCSEFITERLTDDFTVTKIDQINYLDKSLKYFKERDNFELNDFVKNVFDDRKRENLFLSYKEERLSEESFFVSTDTFSISPSAVKKQERVFKSVLKLDKNFHVYIHGDKSLIEKGYDAKVGKSYYKIYFDEET